MPDLIEVTSQEQLDKLPADAIAVVRKGHWYAYDSATVEAYNSATVRAYNSATVEVYDSATVEAYDLATVRASDSATVRASDSATVRAYGSATVRAYGSATVRAYGSATVRASKYVAVHKHGTPNITGGVVIEVPDLDTCGASAWAGYYGVTDDANTAIVYVALDDNWQKGHAYTATTYEPGTTVEAADWQATRQCGHGLHAGPTPSQARQYNLNATRYAAVRIDLTEAVPLGDKVKVQRCEVLYEVDLEGNRVTAEAATA